MKWAPIHEIENYILDNGLKFWFDYFGVHDDEICKFNRLADMSDTGSRWYNIDGKAIVLTAQEVSLEEYRRGIE